MTRSKRVIKIAIFIAALVSFFPQPFAQARKESKERLLKVVVLSRHGARTPIQSREKLERWTEKSWPYWTVKEGDLTQRGSVLVSALWEQMYETLGLEAFFPKNACPGELVYVYANAMERAQATAAAIINGLFPGCKVPFYIISRKGRDPFFLPLGSKKFSIKNIRDVSNEIQTFYGGLEQAQSDLKEPLRLLTDFFGACPKDTCKKFDKPLGCSISDIPSDIDIDPEKNTVKISGGLGAASVLSETLLLEAIQWPKGNFSRVNASPGLIKKVLPIHSKVYAMTNRIPSVALPNGCGMLSAITEALTNASVNKRMNNAKLVIFVGHDTNVVSVASLLSLFWEVGGYPPNEAALGGFIAFSLWETPKGEVVRVHYACQSLESLTNKEISRQEVIYKPVGLELFAQPNSKPSKKQVFECSKEDFIAWTQGVVDKKYIVKPSETLKAKYALD